MKIEMLKQAGGVLIPANDSEVEALSKFKTGEQYQIEIKRTRNPGFHRKTFTFFRFCFEHWSGDNEFLDDRGQFEVFRNNLTVLAGFYNEYFNLRGEIRIEAKSLAYANMSQEEFESHYHALVNAAMKHIFIGCGEKTENTLLEFF